MGTNSAPLLADLFLHTFEYDYMLVTPILVSPLSPYPPRHSSFYQQTILSILLKHARDWLISVVFS